MLTRVASLHFAPLSAERSLYGGRYKIPACKVGDDPHIITIEDTRQRWQGAYNGQNYRSRHSEIVNGELIARDIVNTWTTMGHDMAPNSHPAVWVVRDYLPEVVKHPITGEPTEKILVDADGLAVWRSASMAEKSLMWEADKAENARAGRRYAEAVIGYVDRMDERQRRLYVQNAPTARLACDFYGIDREWNRDMTADSQMSCPFCKKTIIATALKCPNCTEVVNNAEYARLTVMRELALKAERLAASEVPANFKPVTQKPTSGGLGLRSSDQIPEAVTA